MASSLGQVERLYNHRSKNLLDVQFAPRLPAWILCPLHSVQQFGGRDCGDNGLLPGKLAKKTRHVEYSPLVRDQNRAVED